MPCDVRNNRFARVARVTLASLTYTPESESATKNNPYINGEETAKPKN